MPPAFQVIIPVVNVDLADIVLRNMEENSLLPEKIIIINNSQTYYCPISNKFTIEVYRSRTGAVNESLNLGISKVTDCDYVSFLNDDVQIGSWFFQRIHNIFAENKKCSAACPFVMTDPLSLPLVEKKPDLIRMRKREGCAMTFRKEIIEAVPPIPHLRVKTFYGDDWFWLWTTDHIGKMWLKDTGNIIYHMVGQSVLKLDKRPDKEPERLEWYKIKAEFLEGCFK